MKLKKIISITAGILLVFNIFLSISLLHQLREFATVEANAWQAQLSFDQTVTTVLTKSKQ